MNEEELRHHLREAVPAGGHGYGEDDLSQTVAKFGDNLAALHADDHQTQAVWAVPLQSFHRHDDTELAQREEPGS